MPGEYSFPLKFTLQEKTKIEIIEFNGSFIAISDTPGLFGNTKKAFEFHILDLIADGQNIDSFNSKEYIRNRLQRFTKITPQLQRKIDKIRNIKLAEDEKESDEKGKKFESTTEQLPLTGIDYIDVYIKRHNQGDRLDDVGLQLSSSQFIVSANLKKFLRFGNIEQLVFKDGAKYIKGLVDDIMDNPHLQCLVMNDDNGIGDALASILGDALIFNTNLREISLSNNQIGVRGIKDLARALANHQYLEEINLDYNPGVDDDEAVEYLAKSLITMPKLTGFKLAGQFGDRGTLALALLIADKETLHSVSIFLIGGETVSDEGTKTLASAIQKNNSLISIDIRGDFGNEGLRAFASALALTHNPNLKTIILLGSFDEDGLQFLADNLEENHTLTKVIASSDNTEIAADFQLTIEERIRIITERNKATGELRGNEQKYRDVLTPFIPTSVLQAITLDYIAVDPKKMKGKKKTIEGVPAAPAPSSFVAGDARFLEETEAKAKRKSERESRQGLGDDSDDGEPDLNFLKKPSKSPSPTEKGGVKKEDKEQQH